MFAGLVIIACACASAGVGADPVVVVVVPVGVVGAGSLVTVIGMSMLPIVDRLIRPSSAASPTLGTNRREVRRVVVDSVTRAVFRKMVRIIAVLSFP
jgi:type IV secretory pathway ATPase VirB11/archaellum biosynthesis ATPase